jgi:fructuronate reductase
MVNGSHSAIAYLGVMAGFNTVDQALAQPACRRFIARLMHEEIEPTLPALPGLDVGEYRGRLLRRFDNPALQHQTHQIAMDGSQKLPRRLLGTIRDRLDAGASVELLSVAIAAWLHHLRGVDERGLRYDIHDPSIDALRECIARSDRAATRIADPVLAEQERARVLLSFEPVFGTLGHEPVFVAAVAKHLRKLRELGVIATLVETES